MNHLNENWLYKEHQSAYRTLHSTETALLKVHHDITCALDKNNIVLFAMLDLSAAFNTTDQEKLPKVLKLKMNLVSKARHCRSWITSYLQERTQKVRIGCHTSHHVPLLCGVPQGSVLGPLVFTLYTTPLQRIIKNHKATYHRYAVDIQRYVAVCSYRSESPWQA